MKRDTIVEDRKNWMMVLFDVGEQKAALVEKNPTDINSLSESRLVGSLRHTIMGLCTRCERDSTHCS